MIRRLRLLVLLARPAALVLFALFTALGVAQAGQAENRLLLGEALAVVFAFVICCVAVNDLADERIDRVNLAGDPRRPLISGAGTRRELTLIAVASAAVSIVTSSVIGWATLVVTAIGLFISVGYSLPPVRVADRGAVASLLLPACYVAVPFLVGYSTAQVPVGGADLVVLAGLYLGFIGRIVLKDFRDLRGDALFGKRTFLVRHGRRSTCTVSAVAWLAGTALLGVGVHGIAFDAFYFGATIATLAVLKALSRDGGPRRDERLISALAIVGRGLLVTLLAQLATQQAHWSPLWSAAVVASLAVITLGSMVTMLRNGPQSGIAAVQVDRELQDAKS